MTEAERLAAETGVSRKLAAIVVEGAQRAGVSLRSFRADDRRPHLILERRRVTVIARDRGYSSPQIAKALNRDHSTILHAERRGRALAAAGELDLHPAAEWALPAQAAFFDGPLFDLAPAPKSGGVNAGRTIRPAPADRVGVCGRCRRCTADPVTVCCTDSRCPLGEKEAA
jgi:hypothetical protein